MAKIEAWLPSPYDLYVEFDGLNVNQPYIIISSQNSFPEMTAYSQSNEYSGIDASASLAMLNAQINRGGSSLSDTPLAIITAASGFFWFHFTTKDGLTWNEWLNPPAVVYGTGAGCEVRAGTKPSTEQLNTPSNLSATNITSSGATVSWAGDENATSYKVEYRRQGDTTWNE